MLNHRIVLSAAASLVLASLAAAQPTYKGKSVYGIQLERNYRQTSTAGATINPTNPGRFYAFSLPNSTGSVRLPSGVTSTIPTNDDFQQGFATFAALDAAYPPGTYTMSVGSVTGIALTVPANPFPADVPAIVGGTWNAAGQLVINPNQDLTITLSTFGGYGRAGVDTNIDFDINTQNGDSVIGRHQFSSEISAPFTTFTIPAGTLVAGRSYFGSFSMGNMQAANTTAIPTAIGVVMVNNYTEFMISVVVPAAGAPTIARQPAPRTIATGSTVVFSVEAGGTPAPGFQWRRGTTPIAGETRPTLVLSGTAASAANYNCVVTNSAGSVTTSDAVLTVNNVAATDVGRLVNLSVLAPTGPGAQLLTMGATVGGQGATGALPLVIRGIGPTLGTAPFNVGGVLADPTIAITPAGAATASATNDNWGGTPALVAAFSGVGAFALPVASLDSAALQNQGAGGFTVQVAGKGTASGTVIAEVYDGAGATRTATTPRLTNLSTLTSIGQAATLSVGFVLGGTTARSVLVRAVGPTLATAFSISGAMEDPKLELFNNDTGVKIGENDNWGGAAWLINTNTAVGAFALGGAATKDAALVVTLAPGAYSARVSGVNGGGGTAIIEVYEVP